MVAGSIPVCLTKTLHTACTAYLQISGRLAQLIRALPLQGRCPGFESLNAHMQQQTTYTCSKCKNTVSVTERALRRRMRNLGDRELLCQACTNDRKKPSWTIEELRRAVLLSHSHAGVLRRLGLKVAGCTHRVLLKYINEHAMDTSHFHPYSRKQTSTSKSGAARNNLCENSTICQSTLRKYVLRWELLDYKCGVCGITEYMGKPIVLQLDHINGDGSDNRLTNLRWLCPNCRSQTDN